MLSGLSLSEISRIVIFAIPIYPGDLSNQQAYYFEALFDDFADVATMLLPRAHDQKKTGSVKRFLAKLIPETDRSHHHRRRRSPHVRFSGSTCG